jgi:NAD(P)-dependent dehydrogenase (short-subunit alcohol dehydrogenase family)
MDEFVGRVAVVTGAGVGLAVAAELMERGMRVCLTGASAKELDAAVHALGPGSGGDVLAMPGPLLDPHHHQMVVYRVLDVLGRIDVLVNSVPLGLGGWPLVEADLLTLRRALTLDVVVPLAWVQRVYWSWMAAHGGAVLNVASVPADGPSAPPARCDMGREALKHLTRQLARELSPRVRVNAIAPAVTGPDAGGADQERGPGAWQPPASVGTVAAWLLSDRCASITGETLVVHHTLLRPVAAV